MDSRLEQILNGLSAETQLPEPKLEEKPAKVAVKSIENNQAVATEPKPVEIKDKKKEKDMPGQRVIEVSGRNWKLMSIGAIAMVLGFIAIMAFGGSRNMVLGFIAVLALFGGGGLIYWGSKPKEQGIFILGPDNKKSSGPANALNIYPDHIEFAQMPDEELLGQQPRKCRNDNKYYFVHIWGSSWGRDQDRLLAFSLPDTQYRDPREFANNINIPAHRKLAQRRPTLFEKISPVLLLGAMGILALLWTVL